MAAESPSDADPEPDADDGIRRGDAPGEPTDEIEVLEFLLGDTRYCTEITHVEEVVEPARDDLATLPNTPDHVEGVMDLRGETTTIVDPKRIYDVDDETRGELVLVFDTDHLEYEGNVGWLVDQVDEVSHIDADTVDRTVVEEAGLKGIVNRESGFVLWADIDGATDSSTIHGEDDE